MGRDHHTEGHLHRRLRRQSIPTHRPRRHVGLRHQVHAHTSDVAVGTPATYPDFRSWESPDGAGARDYEPGEIETLWVLDLDGTLVVIQTGVWPEPSAGADADFAADVLDSIRIDRA